MKRRSRSASTRSRRVALGAVPGAVLPAILLFAAPTLAQQPPEEGQPFQEDPLVTDRPDFTESPVSVAPGRLQIEGGYTFSRVEEQRDHSIGELLLRIGAVDRLEFRLGINSWVVRNEPDDSADGAPATNLRSVRGLEDLTLGLKVELIRPPPSKPGVPQLAILAGTSLPTGRAEFGAEGLQPGALLSAGWDLSDWLALGTNFGYAYPEDEEGRFDELSGSVALGFGLTDRLGAFAEYFGIYPLPSNRTSQNSADAGITYLLSPNFQLDLRLGVGLEGPGPNLFVGAGASWRI